MSVELRVPQLGMGMTEGRLVEWLVQDGAQVAEGTPVYSIESDKSVQDIEAPAGGVLRIIAAPDATYEVGTLLGEIG